MGMEFVGQDKGSLIKQKQGCMWEPRKTKYLLSTFDQQEMSGHFLGSTASVHRAAAPEDRCFNKECPPSPFSWLLLLSRCHRVWNIPRSCSHPSLLVRWECYSQPCRCGNIVQEQPKHWCFINTFLATNTKHSSTRAARGKITFFSVRPNTTVYLKKLTETFNKITLNSEDLKSQAALGASEREMLCRP